MRSLRQQLRREELFRLARLADGENDDQRARAIRTLHKLYRRQLGRWRQVLDAASLAAFADEEGLLPPWSPPIRPSSREARAAIIDRHLEDLFDGIGLRIAGSKNPVATAKRLFEPKGKRGPKIKNDGRDFEIAVGVERYEKQGLTVEAAAAETARLEGISESRVTQITREQRAKWSPLGIKAEANLVELRAAELRVAELRSAGPAPVKSQDS